MRENHPPSNYLNKQFYIQRVLIGSTFTFNTLECTLSPNFSPFEHEILEICPKRSWEAGEKFVIGSTLNLLQIT